MYMLDPRKHVCTLVAALTSVTNLCWKSGCRIYDIGQNYDRILENMGLQLNLQGVNSLEVNSRLSQQHTPVSDLKAIFI